MNKEEILKEINKAKEHLSNMQKMLKECSERWKPEEAENILVRRQLEDIARRLNKGTKIDWNNYNQAKHCIELYEITL